MQEQSLIGAFEAPPQDAARAFRAALEALARPGTIHEIKGGQAPAPVSEAAASLLLTLCDPETPLCLMGRHDTPEIRDWIAFQIGAPIVGPESAMFALGTWTALQPITNFLIGTPEYPDRSTTLIVEMEALSQDGATLAGPGIKETATLALPDIEPFQMNHALFPLGVDFYFTAGTQIAGLPRSTRISGTQVLEATEAN
ncbi:phosphonate C-P lyase system protein PhnH [Celeribacter neptunius]|uniref:Alpha-D-ribose 1-methylphosphonate 5-triphosphate synthase subunit PhnH n=1 Tax=Celeribacter neptunius TaxID=588602 RepID=A0A1I3QMN0_9RHOB|nr:phosphonate C-P lyase system protein PhnH [Celeribacter neptunius]SFJ35338.1 alpha-D-ribose 1-methylphosphonate 5-triphosphate synthase subunit PhnH [Celeribacter neptunius]